VSKSPNRLLASLPADTFSAISPHLKIVELKFGAVLAEAGSPIRQVYFPYSGVISLVHTDLAAIIGATPSGHLTLLATEYGRPFTPAGFGNAFKDWCRQANLPHCSAHGLRKAMASRLAERGATAHQIMSVTGHRSLEEVERYTRAARQAKLADSAMEKLKGEH